MNIFNTGQELREFTATSDNKAVTGGSVVSA